MKGVLLSDCLYMVKNSTYTGVNNIVPYNPFVKDLKNALWAGETEKAQQALGQILEATLSFYHEYHEYSYHLILNGFFTGQGYRVLSETETGYGRSDLVVLDPARRRCLILELKHVKKEEQMEAALHEAQSQLILQKYESRLVLPGLHHSPALRTVLLRQARHDCRSMIFIAVGVLGVLFLIHRFYCKVNNISKAGADTYRICFFVFTGRRTHHPVSMENLFQTDYFLSQPVSRF